MDLKASPQTGVYHFCSHSSGPGKWNSGWTCSPHHIALKSQGKGPLLSGSALLFCHYCKPHSAVAGLALCYFSNTPVAFLPQCLCPDWFFSLFFALLLLSSFSPLPRPRLREACSDSHSPLCCCLCFVALCAHITTWIIWYICSFVVCLLR